MLFNKKATFIVADGQGDDFSYHKHDLYYRKSKGQFKFVSLTKSTTTIETDISNLKGLMRKTKYILDRSKVSIVENEKLPSTLAKGFENYTVVASDKTIALLGSYLETGSRKYALHARYLEHQNDFYNAQLKRTKNDPQFIGLSDENIELFMDLLKVCKDVVVNRRITKKDDIKDYYTLLEALFNLRQRTCKEEIVTSAKDLVKKYTK